MSSVTTVVSTEIQESLNVIAADIIPDLNTEAPDFFRTSYGVIEEPTFNMDVFSFLEGFNDEMEDSFEECTDKRMAGDKRHDLEDNINEKNSECDDNLQFQNDDTSELDDYESGDETGCDSDDEPQQSACWHYESNAGGFYFNDSSEEIVLKPGGQLGRGT